MQHIVRPTLNIVPSITIVLPPVSTQDVLEDSASIDILSNDIRNQMLETLRDISPQPLIHN